jgi:hypothetical protein
LITEDDNAMLCLVPSEEEIKEAVFSLGSNKSPATNGMLTLFYKHFWNTISRDVVTVVESFFQSARILKESNHTFITRF